MFWIKLQSKSLGQFWLELDLSDIIQAKAFADGLVLGAELGKSILIKDTRLSKHKSELTMTVNELRESLRE